MENAKVEKSNNELIPITIESKDIGSLVYVIMRPRDGVIVSFFVVPTE